jgi:four helix bundle protein
MDASISSVASGRPAARTFHDLVVWRKAHEFVLAAYSFTANFPKSETYGLASQMRRSAVSIPANIAEGFRRRGRADKARFMNIAEGSWKRRATISSWLRILDTATVANWRFRSKKSAVCFTDTQKGF